MWALEPFRMMTEPAHFWSEISCLFSLSMGIIYWDTYSPYPKTYLHVCEPSKYGKNLLHLMWILRTSDCNNHKQCNHIKEAYITLTKYAMTEMHIHSHNWWLTKFWPLCVALLCLESEYCDLFVWPSNLWMKSCIWL